MPRYFAPVGGFQNIKAKAIKVAPGQSFEVMADGTETLAGHVGKGHRWIPTWTESEMENLVKGGSWREVPAAELSEKEPLPATVAPVATPKRKPAPAPNPEPIADATPTPDSK